MRVVVVQQPNQDPSKQGQPNQRQKRARQEEHEEHLVHDESNWLVSYADMMTLLFGFFVLMYAFSRIDTEKFTVVSKKVAQYFGGQVKEDPAITSLKDRIDKAVVGAGADKNVKVISTPGGLELNFTGHILFAAGSARLKHEMRPLMTKITRLIGAQKRVNEVRVEGHTDDDPIYSKIFPTNWELSSARATRIVRQFLAAGMKKDTLVAEGYAESRPIVPNRDDKGKAIEANQSKNRRVVISLSYGSDLSAAAQGLDSKEFVPAGENREGKDRGHLVDPVKEMMDEADSQSKAEGAPADPLERRMHFAKKRMAKAKEKMRAAKVKEKEEKRREQMKKRIQSMEQKALKMQQDAEKLLQKSGQPSSRLPSSGSGRQPMTMQQGLKELERRAREAPSPASNKK